MGCVGSRPWPLNHKKWPRSQNLELQAPQLTMPKETDVVLGGTKHFECRVVGFPTPEIRWYKDGVEITRNKRYRFDHTKGGIITMVIENVHRQDEGCYKCRAENSQGFATTSAFLFVKARRGHPDEDTLSVHSMTFDDDSDAELVVNGTGSSSKRKYVEKLEERETFIQNGRRSSTKSGLKVTTEVTETSSKTETASSSLKSETQVSETRTSKTTTVTQESSIASASSTETVEMSASKLTTEEDAQSLSQADSGITDVLNASFDTLSPQQSVLEDSGIGMSFASEVEGGKDATDGERLKASSSVETSASAAAEEALMVQAEVEMQQTAAKKERDEAEKEKEKKEKEAKEAKEKEEKEAKEKAEREAKEKAEREAKEKAEREAKEKAEREAKEKAEREAKEKAEREAKEKAEKEAKEKAEREAKEKAEREAKEKAEREAKEKAEREAKEKAEREAKEKAEKEAKEKAEREAKEKAEREAKEKAEQEAREKAEREAKEKAEREAKEKAEREAKEKAEREAKEKAEREAKEKAEQEAKEKAEREAKEKAEQEAKEKAEREAKEKAEREAKEKAEKEAKEKAEQEAKEKAEREAKEKAEREAKEKAEREAKEKAEREAKEKAEREAKEKAEREAKEKAEREAKEKAEQEAREKAVKEAKEKAEREAKEKAEQEAKEKAEQEAKEKAEREAKEKAEREAKEKAEREAKEKAEREAKEKAEQEAREKAEKEAKEKAEREAKEKAEREAKEKAEREAKEKAEREAKEKAEKEAKEKAEQEAREKAEKEAKEKAEREAKEVEEKISKEEATTEESKSKPSLHAETAMEEASQESTGDLQAAEERQSRQLVEDGALEEGRKGRFQEDVQVDALTALEAEGSVEGIVTDSQTLEAVDVDKASAKAKGTLDDVRMEERLAAEAEEELLEIKGQSREHAAPPSAPLTPPTVVSVTEDVTAKAGDSVMLTAEVQGLPEPEVKWFRAGDSVKTGGRVTVRSEGSVHSLQIRRLDTSDSGTYTLTAHNSEGTIFSDVLITVVSVDDKPAASGGTAPRFTATPGDVTATEFQRVRMTCTVEGDPKPEVSWSFGGKPLESDRHFRVCEADGEFYLEIAQCRLPDAGEYRCVAVNAAGEAVCTVQLIVEGAKESSLEQEPGAPVFSIESDSSATDERFLETFTMLAEYRDSDSGVLVAKGEVVEVLDSRQKTTGNWLVRRQTSKEKILFVPASLLQKEGGTAKQELSVQEDGHTQRQKRLSRSPSKKSSTEVEPGDTSEDEVALHLREVCPIYIVIADCSGEAFEAGGEAVRLCEGQLVELLDAAHADRWLIRTKPTKQSPARLAWVAAAFLEAKVSPAPLLRRSTREVFREDIIKITNKQQEAMVKRSSVDEDEEETAVEVQPPKKEESKEYALTELIEVEREYVRDLKKLMETFLPRLQKKDVPSVIKNKHDVIFANIQEIHDFHSGTFLAALTACTATPGTVGKVFMDWSEKLQAYVPYLETREAAECFLNTEEAREFVKGYCRELSEMDTALVVALQRPRQQIETYRAMLKDFLRYTCRAGEDTGTLEAAIAMLTSLGKKVQQRQLMACVDGFVGDLSVLGDLIRHDDLLMWDSDVSSTRAKDRHVFLFPEKLLLTKAKKAEIPADSQTFAFKTLVDVQNVQIKESVPEDERRFEVWYAEATSEKLTFQAKNSIAKQIWVQDIREVLRNLGVEETDVMPSPVVEEGEGEDKVRVPKRKQEPADVTGPEVDTDSDHKDDFVSLSSYESDVNSYHTAPEFPDGTSRPHFRIRPKKALVKEGGSALLECVVGGIPVPGVTWLYKNEPVRPSDSLRVEGEGETSQLVFPKVSLDQGGLYTAKASNLNGSILSSADLVVLQDFDEETVQPAENGVTAESAKETQEAASTAEAVEKAEAPKLEEPSKPTKKEPEDKKPKEEDKKEKDKKAEEAEKAETKTKPKEPEAVVKDQVDAPVKEEVLQKAEVAPEEKSPKAEEKPQKEEEKPVAEEKVKPETAPEAKEEPVAKKEAEKDKKKKEDKKPEEVKEQPKEEKAPEKKKEKAEEPAKKATEEEKPADKKEKPEEKPKASEPKEDSLSATEVKAEAKPETKADSKTLESAEKTKPAQKEQEPVEAKSVEPKEDTLSSEEKQLEAKPRPEADTKTLESAKTTKPEEKKAAAEEEKEGKAPVIMGSMADITLEPGRLARFDCRIVAYPEPTITWLKDGKAVRHCDHTQLINCDGEVYSLLIRDVTKDDNGLYTCLAVNKFGEAKSEALLNVIDLQKLEDDEDTAPSFVTRFYDVEVLENVPADFQCLIKGRPFPKVQWLLNGRELKEGPELMLWQEGNQARMAIRHAKLEQSGEVICRISNDLGEATCSAQLVVVEDMSKFHAAPVFVKEPHDVEVDAGEDVTFECVIQGLPVPEVTWHFRARELFESKRRIMESDGDTHRLTLRDVVSDNSGEYVIKASNIIGDATCRVRLTVNKPRESLADIGSAEVPGSKYGYAPSFTRRLQDLRGAPGSMATMECRVIGVPDPIVTWEKDGKTLVGNDRVQVSADSSNPSVTILSLEPDDTGEYTCLVSNDAGKSSCTGRLRVQAEKARPRYSPDKELIEEYAPPAKVPLKILDEGIPEMPQDKPVLMDIRPDSVRLKWLSARIPESDKAGPVRYVVEGRALPDSRWLRMETGIPSTAQVIRGLKPDREYDFRIRAETKLGSSQPTLPATLEKREPRKKAEEIKAPPVLPSYQPYITDMGPETVRLAWKPAESPVTRTEMPGVSYRLETQRLPSEDWVPMATRLRSPSYYIPDLPPDRDYMMRVRAENEYGLSEPTAPIWLPRAKAFPGVPVGRPRIIEMGDDMVKLSWTRVDVPATQADEEPLLYMIEMQEPPSHVWRTIAERVPKENYLITDLQPGTDYRFRVRSQTPDGRISEPSPATSIFRTLATTRVPVDDLTVEQYEPEDEAVTLSWQRVRVPPFHRDEDTLLFMLEYQEPAIGEWRPLASGLPTTRYRVPDIGPTQDYRFRVRGLSPHGVSPPSYPAGLYRSVSPMRPIAERLEISDLEPESLRLSWRPSPARSTEPLTYLIEGRELPNMEWRPLARDVADTSYRLGGLRSSADYAFRVAPTSAAIAGLEPSPPVSLTSLPVVPRLPASSLTLRESGPDSVDLHWQPANLGVYSRRDVPIFYTVEQCEVPGAWTTVARRVPKTSYSVTGLRPDRDYRFRVRPDTDFGSGDFTLPVMLHRHIAGSLPQREPIISDVTGDSLLLTWEPVRFPRGGDADVSYNVEMLEPPGSYWLPICTGLRTTSYRVRHLNPDRDYMFRVVAVSDRVDPSPTPAAYLARRAGPPKLPREAPFVSDLQPDSLTLNWRAVDIPSRITDYSPVTYRIEILDSPLHAWRTLAQGITRTQHHITGLAPDMDFSFRIRAENEFGLSEPTDILLVRRRAVPPIMPQEEPMITDVRPGSLRLSWRPAECPSFIRDYVPITYSILVQEPPDSSWQPLVRRVPTTSYHVTGLDPDKTYLFRVVADNEYGTSTPTPYVQLRRMPDFRAPVLLPEIEDVEPTGGLRLSWRPKAELPKPSHYSLETYEPLERTWRPLATKIPDTRYRLTDLAPSRDYLFRVRPELDTGPAEPSYPLLYSRHRVAPKVPVERPQLWDISPDSVRISWLPVRLSAYDRPPTSIRYQLEQRDLPHGSWTVVAPRVLDHSYFLHGLKPSLDYAFRVRIVDDDGVSEPSIPVYLYRRPVIPSLPLERPRIESLDDEAVRLRWNRVSVPPFDVDEDDLTFMIEAQRLPEQDWRPLARGIRDTQHRISGLTPGHNYHFRVRGESSIGLTMPSTYIPYYRRPLRANVPITYPSIEDVDTSSARLRWRPVYIPPYVSPSTTYSVEVQEPPRRDWRSLASDVPGYDYLVSDLAPRRDYLFRIRARSPAGDYSEPTAPIPYYKGHLLRYESLPVVSMRPLALEAFTPTRIYIDTLTVRVPPHLPMEKPEMMEVNPQSVRLAWKPARVSAATASLSPLTYKIEARVGPSLDWEELASGLVGQGHMLTDLNPHLDYCFRVRAVNEFGDSEPTMPVYLYRKREYDFEFFDGEGEEFFFGPEIPSALPKMPMDTPKLLDVTGDSLTLRWKPGRIPLYAEKVPITYTVEMCEAPSASWKTLASGIASTQHQVTGLHPESDYSFRVRAISMHGSSESTIPATLLRHPRASSTPRGSSISRMSSERDAFPQLPKTPYVNVISSGVPPRVPHGRPLISAQKEDSLMLSWNPARLPSYMKPTPITYSVEVKEPPGYLWSLLADKVKDTKYLVTDLRPEQDYMFRIRAENEFGRSEPTLPASLLRVREEPKPEPRRSVSRDRSMTPRRLLQRFASVERSMEKEKEQEELVGHTPETSPSQPEFLAVSSDSMFGAEGQPVKISLRVRGYPPPRVSWYVKGEKADIGDRYDSYITPSGQVVLEFENMTWDDVGEYKAYAENEHGTASKVINLLMADPPTFVEPLKDLVLVYQQSGKLEARVDGLPYPTIRWTKDWRPVGKTSRVTTEHDGDYWALSIEDAIPTDEGLYACVAENVAGKALCSARVSVEDKHFSKADMTFKDSSIEDYYYILEELGRGRHGVVRRLIEKTTGHEFVGKFVRVRSEADKDFFKCELESLRLVNHKNVLHVEDAYETPKRLITVSELVSGEELLERAVAADSWTESDMAYFVHQLLEALSHLHQCGVAHLDIKPSNILLTKHDSDEIKLIDFGFARKLPVARDFRFNYGSPEVASPEAVKDESVTMASDMWSVGVLTYILLSGLSPFRGASVSETLRKVKDADWKFDDKVFADVSKEAKDFISKLLVLKPDSRLTVQQCLEHPWIKMAVKRGQGLKINTARLRQYLATSRAERAENAVRVAAQLRSLRSLMEGVASEAGLLPITDAESGQVIFPDSEAYGEFLDDETWYDWQSRYQFGPDTQLLPLHEADYTARVRGYRRSMSRSLPPDPQATMKERRLMSDIDKEELPPSLEKEMEFLSRKKEEPDSKRSSICSAIGEPGVPGPIFHEHLRDIAFVPGETVILYCQVAGDPPPTVAWYRNEELLTDGPRVKTYLGENGVATLTLSSAKPYDIGVYKCVARSKTGRSSSRARILMGDVPDRPGRPVVAQVSSEEALVIWDAPRPRKRGNSDILYYKVDYKKNGDARWTTGCCVPLESALVGGLSPNSPYRFRVCCVNKFGPGAYSWSSVEIHTRPAGCPPLKADGDRDLELLRARQMDLKAILKAAEETEEEEELPTGPAPLLESSPEKEYELGDVLLKGHFSELRQCKKPSINQTFTVKVTPLTSARKEEAMHEFDILRDLRHDRIIRVIEGYKMADTLYLICEKLCGDHVVRHLSLRRKYSEECVARIVRQLLAALQWLQHLNIVHLNLQPSSVLMESHSSYSLRLADFSHAIRIPPDAEGESVQRAPRRGYPDFIPPEVVGHERVSFAADMWGVGNLAFLLLSGQTAYGGVTDEDTLANVAYNRYDAHALYENATTDAVKFIFKVMKRLPRNRPSVQYCLEHKWLQYTDHSVKTREDTIFLSNKLRAFANLYDKRRLSPDFKDDFQTFVPPKAAVLKPAQTSDVSAAAPADVTTPTADVSTIPEVSEAPPAAEAAQPEVAPAVDAGKAEAEVERVADDVVAKALDEALQDAAEKA